jgi:hypothetical protein
MTGIDAYKKLTRRLSAAFQSEKLDLSPLHLAGPFLMLLSIFMFRSCLLNQIYLFLDKSLKDPNHEATGLLISADESDLHEQPRSP